MINSQDQQYKRHVKKAWIIYTLLTIALIVVLVLFLAEDNEERFFFAIMPAAAAYVFRPMNKPFSKLIFKYTGMSHPSEENE